MRRQPTHSIVVAATMAMGIAATTLLGSIAYGVLLTFLFAGKYILQLLSLQQETISIAGGIVLFLIALRMVFPREEEGRDTLRGEPLIEKGVVRTPELDRVAVVTQLTEDEQLGLRGQRITQRDVANAE